MPPASCEHPISITAEPIKFEVSSIDSFELYDKNFNFFFCVPCERRYHDAKSESKNFSLETSLSLPVEGMCTVGTFVARGGSDQAWQQDSASFPRIQFADDVNFATSLTA